MKALIVVDVQNDFLPGGALAVPSGDEILAAVNDLIPAFECVVCTQDWHPADHGSFASNHPGKSPYDVIEMEYGSQVLWPDHCIQGTPGAAFHRDLDFNSAQLIIRKGFRPDIDSYSAFFENDHKTTTGLDGYLKERGISEIYLCGLATDFCVKWSALDAIKKGYKTYVFEDAVRGIDLDNSVEAAFQEMKEAGVNFIDSSAYLEGIE